MFIGRSTRSVDTLYSLSYRSVERSLRPGTPGANCKLSTCDSVSGPKSRGCPGLARSKTPSSSPDWVVRLFFTALKHEPVWSSLHEARCSCGAASTRSFNRTYLARQNCCRTYERMPGIYITPPQTAQNVAKLSHHMFLARQSRRKSPIHA